jgi:hypothetical protein
MTLRQRDKRSLWVLAGAVVLILILRFGLPGDEQPAVVTPSDSIPLAEKRLARLRQLAAGLSAREQSLQGISAELAQREKGMIEAETAAQAQAHLLQVLRRLAGAQTPPVEIRTVEMGQVRSLGDSYGEASVPVVFECRIEQLLNMLAELTALPEALATGELRIWAADEKEKTMNVRLTVSGVVSQSVVPKKRGLASF